jgi:hypothetical protein
MKGILMKNLLTLLFTLLFCLGMAQMVSAQVRPIDPIDPCPDCNPDPCPDCNPGCGPNPIDDATFFVRQQYRDFLFREPTSYELANDVAPLNSCLNYGDLACYNTERVHMSRRMWDKAEFRQQSRTFGLPLFPDSNDPSLQFEHYNDDDFVRLEYYIYLQRSPSDPPDDYRELGYHFWLDSLNNCVRNAGSFQGSDQCYNDSINAFLSSTEYRSRFGCP